MGMLVEMVPDPVPDKVPIATGVLKLPVASDNCAVKTLPELKVPVAVNGIEVFAFWQMETGALFTARAGVHKGKLVSDAFRLLCRP